MAQELYMMTVPNNIDEVEKLLLTRYKKVNSVKHIGDFVFVADVGVNWTVTLRTKPVNEDESLLRIVGVDEVNNNRPKPGMGPFDPELDNPWRD